MTNKKLAFAMALIMCFSFVFGAAAASEGEQIVPSTSQVSPTEKEDFVDSIGGMLGDTAGDKFSEVGDELMDGIQKGNIFFDMIQRVIDTIKVLWANIINTIFPFFNIGSGSILG